MAEKKFTRDELAKYNGDGEKPHYMAIDGLVYDITDAPKKGISIKEFNGKSFLAVQKKKMKF